MASFKIEFDTVRDLEKKSFRFFAYGGGALLAGIVTTLIGLIILGLPLLIAGAVMLLAAITWITVIGREQARPVFCPYCASKNDVYQSRSKFACDICGRPVVMDEAGEPRMAEEIDTQSRY